MIDFERLLKTLSSSRVDFVIVGGVAATIHGSARLTTDLDVVYDRKPDKDLEVIAELEAIRDESGAR